MEKEFNLSEKIEKCRDCNNRIREEYVKEFIKKLKEMIPPEECGYGDCIHCRIDKLAGDDLK